MPENRPKLYLNKGVLPIPTKLKVVVAEYANLLLVFVEPGT
jgi:hypothetical protein